MNRKGDKWNDEKVGFEVKKVIDALCLNRMPSRSEMKLVSGNTALANIIMKNGGFYHWAEKLGLQIKKSDTNFGMDYEKKCCEDLRNRNFEAELTTVKFPYDLLVNKCVKIDVKVSKGYEHGYFFFTYNLESKKPRCDIYVFYGVNENRGNKTFIIPANKLYGISQLSIGLGSKYDKYIERWDLINKFCSFYQNVS
jgi:hypothetical protein